MKEGDTSQFMVNSELHELRMTVHAFNATNCWNWGDQI